MRDGVVEEKECRQPRAHGGKRRVKNEIGNPPASK
jgi:hypothetical protein